MINEQVLKETLIALVELNKKATATSIIALNQIAAIRETVRPLDPAFSDVFSDKKTYYEGATDQLSAEIKEEYDSLIQRLNDTLIS